MNALSKLLVVSLAMVLVLGPLATTSVGEDGKLALPLKKVVNPPQETIKYAGETLKFTTDVPIKIVLFDLGPDRIRLEIYPPDGSTGGNAPASSNLIVLWEDWNNEIYNGGPPLDPWSVDLLTESGFTEK